jgi:tetratricopeptide (TPR) repeat protein/transglutaminase-like putative cysteine protease
MNMRQMSLQRIGLLAFLCFSFVPKIAGQNSFPDTPAFSLSPKALLQSAAGAPKEASADAMILLIEQRDSIDELGRDRQSRHVVYRVDTARGVKNWASVVAYYWPWHQSKPAIRARVITPDGIQHDLDSKTMSESAVKNDESLNMYSDLHVYEGPLPAVSIGSVIEEEIVTEDTLPYFQGTWSLNYGIGRNQPVLRTKLTVESPASLPLHYKTQLAPDLKVQESENNGRKIYSFEYGRTEALESKPMLAPEIPRHPVIYLTTASSWQEIASEYWKRTEPRIRPEEVKSLVAGINPGDKDAISRLLEKVHANVRYTGLELGEASLIPQPPSEILKREYGDCKEKAALLVSMLRAIGIPAYLALLNAGGGRDLPPEIPGMIFFNHAIVYIPGRDLFIDATAQYSRVGELPVGDQDRWALVIAEKTAELKRIPQLPSGSNRTVETREFFLKDYGPARVIQTTRWFGSLESYFRSLYSGSEKKNFKENLNRYAQEAYLADTVSKYEHGDINDFSKPFMLRIEIPEAKRGLTDMSESAVAIRLADMVSGQIPPAIQKEDKKENETSVAEKVETRTEDWYLDDIYQTEWQYRITPPIGFHVRGLPENKTVDIGPAVFTQEFRALDDGAVEATIRVDLVRRRYKDAEVSELRRAMKQLRENGILTIHFDLKAGMLLQQGKVREALKEFRRLATENPKDSVFRARLARACITASLGEMARTEAQKAVRLDPKSAVAYDTLGFVLQHDLVGRKYAKGFDPAGSAAAYRKAKELDPKEPSYAFSLGEMLEYDAEGERYVGAVKLDEAVDIYRELKKNEKVDADAVHERLLYALAYARRFTDVRDLLADLRDSPLTRVMRIVATAGLEGSEAAIRKAGEISKNEKYKSDALAQAGATAMRIRMYPEAAELLAAGAIGQPNSSSLANLAQTLKRTIKHENYALDSKDPIKVVLHAFIATNYPEKRPDLKMMMSRAFFKLPEESAADILKKHWSLRFVTDLPQEVMLDITLALLKMNVEGNDESGYRITIQTPGTEAQHVFIVKEEGVLKILSENQDLSPMGQEVLDRIARNDLKGAKVLLDWARDERKLVGGEDPYAGPAFARIWSKNSEANADKMRIAGLVLLCSANGAARPYISEAEAVWKKIDVDIERAKIDEALAAAYLNVKDWPKLERLVSEMMQRTESASLFRKLAVAKGRQKKWEDLSKLIQQYKGKLNDEEAVAIAEADVFLAQNQSLKALELLKAFLDSGKGNAAAVNFYGWAAVIAGEVKPEVLEVVQQTVQQPKNQQYAILHTLGCMYAIDGRTTQAKQILLEAMKRDQSADEPESSIWFGFALLAENYGEIEAAVKLYGKVEKQEYEDIDEEVSTYFLAQRRSAALKNIFSPAGP